MRDDATDLPCFQYSLTHLTVSHISPTLVSFLSHTRYLTSIPKAMIVAKSATSAVDYVLGVVLMGVVLFGFVGIFRRLKLHEAITGELYVLT